MKWVCEGQISIAEYLSSLSPPKPKKVRKRAYSKRKPGGVTRAACNSEKVTKKDIFRKKKILSEFGMSDKIISDIFSDKIFHSHSELDIFSDNLLKKYFAALDLNEFCNQVKGS